MVQQYTQNNINSPRGSRLYSADASLDLDSDMVVVTTAGGPVTITLPTAPQIPGQEVTIKADDAGSTGNAVTIAALAGQNIDGTATITLTADQESACLKSDGSNWRRVCGGAGGGGSCCPPSYLHQNMWDAYGYSYLSTAPSALDLDASLCGQDLPITAAIRASAFSPAGTPPTVLSAGVDPVLNTARVTWDDGGEDGRFVLEITNACGCCWLFPIEGFSL